MYYTSSVISVAAAYAFVFLSCFFRNFGLVYFSFCLFIITSNIVMFVELLL